MNTKIYHIAVCALLILAGMSSCTHEYVPDVTNEWRMEVKVNFADAEFWPENQQIRLGLFDAEGDKEPVSWVAVNEPSGQNTTVSLSDVPEGNYYMNLYLTESSIYKVNLASFGSITVNEDLYVNSDEVTLLRYERVQNQIFNKCQLCHGGSSGDLAANLDLTAAHSFEQLVNVDAEMNASMVRVIPGSADFSYLVMVLDGNINFDHDASNSITDADKQLIKDWINEGAKNN